MFIVTDWVGDPVETEEMKPKWFNILNLPLDSMWEADKQWLPIVLKNVKLKGDIFFTNEGQVINCNLQKFNQNNIKIIYIVDIAGYDLYNFKDYLDGVCFKETKLNIITFKFEVQTCL